MRRRRLIIGSAKGGGRRARSLCAGGGGLRGLLLLVFCLQFTTPIITQVTLPIITQVTPVSHQSHVKWRRQTATPGRRICRSDQMRPRASYLLRVKAPSRPSERLKPEDTAAAKIPHNRTAAEGGGPRGEEIAVRPRGRTRQAQRGARAEGITRPRPPPITVQCATSASVTPRGLYFVENLCARYAGGWGPGGGQVEVEKTATSFTPLRIRGL